MEPQAIISTIFGLSGPEDVFGLLGALGRRCHPIDLSHAEASPWESVEISGAWLTNLGDQAPLWVLELAGITAEFDVLEPGLRSQAHTSAGGVAAALVLNSRHELGLLIAVDGEREVEQCSSSSSQFENHLIVALRLLQEKAPTARVLLHAYRALQRRRIGHAFFREVRRDVAAISAAWERGPAAVEDRRALAIVLLCRLMFLHFVQARGWLAGDACHLANQLLDPAGEQLYARRLKPMFFEVLNTVPAARRGVWAASELPYLNGGLFEPTALELAYPDLGLPDAALRPLAATLERTLFVETEDATGKAGLNPETLGSVFEALMSPELRESSGAFYTPPLLVEVTVEEALRIGLSLYLPGELVERLLKPATTVLESQEELRPQEEEALRHALSEFALLDPAMGSGAFLVGALQQIVRLRTFFLGQDPAQAIRDTLERNLYGVDLSETACTIASLRLWLALASAVDTGPEPLPNLAHKLRRGNALWGFVTLNQLQGLALPSEVVAQLRFASDEYAHAHGEAKAPAAAALKKAELAVALAAIQGARDRATGELRELQAREAPDLLGHRTRPGKQELERRAALHDELQRLQDLEAGLVRGEWTPAFDFSIHFGAQMARGGFDVVVGNPPWVRLSNIPKQDRELMKQCFAWMRSPGRGSAFGGQADLSVAFAERALQLTRPGGALALVVPAKLFSAGYGSTFRKELPRQATLHRLSDLSDSPLGHFDAGVFPALLVAQKGRLLPPPALRVSVGSGELLSTSAESFGHCGAPWSLHGDAAAELLSWLAHKHPTLASDRPVHMGVKTGANPIFVDRESAFEESLPLLRGRGIAAMEVRELESIAFAHDPLTGEVLEDQEVSASLKAWLEPHSERLARRADARPGDPPWRLFRIPAGSLGHRVAWRDIGQTLEAVWLPPVVEGGPVGLNSTYHVGVSTSAEGLRLAAWLCSAPVRFVAGMLAERALNGFRRFQAFNVGAVPFPLSLKEPSGLDGIAARLAKDARDGEAWRELDRWAIDTLSLSVAQVGTLVRMWEVLGMGDNDRKEALMARLAVVDLPACGGVAP